MKKQKNTDQNVNKIDFNFFWLLSNVCKLLETELTHKNMS